MPATVLDEAGRLLVMGGFDPQRSWNDVWRSTMSFNSYAAVSAACGVTIPACGPGLSCLPNDPTFQRLSDGSVWCAQLRDCANAPSLRFTLQTIAAAWSARAAMQVELYGRALSYTSTRSGQTVRLPANSLIMQGSLDLENDVWISGDHGRSWDLLSGVTTSGARAAAPFDAQSFSASKYGGFAVTSDYAVFRIGGALGSGQCNAVWSSTDGKVWRNAITASSRVWSPLRDETVAVADDQGFLYYMAGRQCGNTAIRLNDVWQSTNRGQQWTLKSAAAPWSGRVAPMVVAIRPRNAAHDALLLFGGVDSQPPRDLNDCWLSVNQGATWLLMTANAHFPSRNNHNAEVTKAGLVVMTAGKHDHPDGRREYLNDVYVSADGGYNCRFSLLPFALHRFLVDVSAAHSVLFLACALRSGGLCAQDAPFEDRRVPATVLDESGHLLVMGGYDDQGRRYNDVWRTAVSFDDYTQVARICNVTIPSCGPGLTCLPSDPGFQRIGEAVTCNALRACSTNPVLPSSMEFILQCGRAPWSPRGTMQVEMYGRPTSFRSTTTGAVVSVSSNSFVLMGNQNYAENDVWLSSDKGRTWNLIAGVSLNGTSGPTRAAEPYDAQSFPVPVARFGGMTMDAQSNLYRIGGRTGPSTCTGETWISADGKTWTNQAGGAEVTPQRDETASVVDSLGRLYLMGGRTCVERTNLNDVWTSADRGRNWRRQTAAAPWSARVAAFGLLVKSSTVGADVILLYGGQADDAYKNDVWASTTQGRTWVSLPQVSGRSWAPRNFHNSELVKNGLIVLTAGRNSGQSYLNDLWVSADGGYTWGQCAEDAAYSDRRLPATLVDDAGVLFVMGGYDERGMYYADVWKTAVSFLNLKTVSGLCGVTIPSCGPGLHCLPGMDGFTRTGGQVWCDAMAECGGGGERGASSSSGDGGMLAGQTNDLSGLSGWGLGLFLIALLALAAGGWFFFVRKAQASAAESGETPGKATEEVLLTSVS